MTLSVMKKTETYLGNYINLLTPIKIQNAKSSYKLNTLSMKRSWEYRDRSTRSIRLEIKVNTENLLLDLESKRVKNPPAVSMCFSLV